MPQVPPKQPPAQQGVPPGVHMPPEGMQLPMSGGGWSTTVCVHCAVWLCLRSSWNGSQKATNDGSLELNSRCDRLIAAIQICGCSQFASNGWLCAPPACCSESDG